MFAACSNGDYDEVMELLLSHGADPNYSGMKNLAGSYGTWCHDGVTALYLAEKVKSHPKCAALLREALAMTPDQEPAKPELSAYAYDDLARIIINLAKDNKKAELKALLESYKTTQAKALAAAINYPI